MTTRLIVNADDLGLHPSIDEGILRAHREGIVTSTTVLVTGPSAPEAIRRARAQGLSIGVHLCFTTHLPPASNPTEVPSLAPGGRFRAKWPQVALAWARRQIALDEVEREARAQLALARKLGAEPDHLDGHQHLHLLPGFARGVQRIAREEQLPLRWPIESPRREWLRRPGAALKGAVLSGLALGQRSDGVRRVRGLGVFEAGMLTEERLLRILEALPEGDVELGAHPGLAPDRVPEEPGWIYGWEAELAALCSPKVRASIERHRIDLRTYRDLMSASPGERLPHD